MREYELTLVFSTEIDDATRDQLFERIKGLMPLAEGTEISVKSWGRRKLAYPIQKQKFGHYVLVEAEMDGNGLSEFERVISYEEPLLRHLIVRKG